MQCTHVRKIGGNAGRLSRGRRWLRRLRAFRSSFGLRSCWDYDVSSVWEVSEEFKLRIEEGSTVYKIVYSDVTEKPETRLRS